ncbi:MAG: DUF3299 domain-containing protein [Gammaproteobacteria bacterium]|nr:DUF3299 domain-containing protein [Gammaproteobacteria bacterium]MCP5426067.1 DUF3299 domain-containing protein [Gammaproteobacteria bacterium]
MKIRIALLVCAVLAVGGLVAAYVVKPGSTDTVSASAEPAKDLEWEALIPADWNPDQLLAKLSDTPADAIQDSSEQAEKLMAEIRQIWNNAPVVEALNGQRVRLPGYVVPLEYSATDVSEFLLVPYFGACIHVPPPPSNQVVYVKTHEPFKIDETFAAVWVTGTLTTTRVDNDLGDAGYTLDAQQIAPYDETADGADAPDDTTDEMTNAANAPGTPDMNDTSE